MFFAIAKKSLNKTLKIYEGFPQEISGEIFERTKTATFLKFVRIFQESHFLNIMENRLEESLKKYNATLSDLSSKNP